MRLSFAKTPSAGQVVDLSALIRREWPSHDHHVLHLLRLFPFLCGGHRQLALENLALRQQLTVYRRTVARPRLRRGDRLFWVALSRLWRGWKQALVIVAPDSVLCWQRRRFRDYWTRRSRRSVVGRPPVAPEIRALVAQMPQPIPSGVPPESMASCSSWASTWPSAPSPG
jgi:hypothetical protein